MCAVCCVHVLCVCVGAAEGRCAVQRRRRDKLAGLLTAHPMPVVAPDTDACGCTRSLVGIGCAFTFAVIVVYKVLRSAGSDSGVLSVA